MVGSFEHGNEISDFVRSWDFFLPSWANISFSRKIPFRGIS